MSVSQNRHHAKAKRALRRALSRRVPGLDAASAPGWHIMMRLLRFYTLHDYIDEAYQQQPFLPNMAPNAPANRHRFKTYVEHHSRVTSLIGRVMDLWMLIWGLKREDNWVPLLREDMQRRVAMSNASAGHISSRKSHSSKRNQ